MLLIVILPKDFENIPPKIWVGSYCPKITSSNIILVVGKHLVLEGCAKRNIKLESILLKG